MLNKRFLMLAIVVTAGVLVIAGYNRPYRWWPMNDMAEQEYIKAFTKDSGRAPAEGTVTVDEWDFVPNKLELANYPDFKNPTGGVADTTSVARGKELYDVYCWPCHGAEMSADEAKFSPVRRGNRPGSDRVWAMPAANIDLVKNYSDEHIFAVITHGSAIMKRMSYHLSPEERWDVVNYVRSLADKAQ